MSGGARGIDVSSWQHPAGKPIDWEEVAESGVTFALVKATQGISYVNPWFERDYEDAYAAGLLVGAWHYFDPSVDPAAQAANFVAMLMGKRLEARAWLDFEPPPVTNWTAAGWVTSFLDAAREARPGCGLYCDQSWWEQLAAANVAPPALWLAAPSATEPPAGATIWQHGTGDVPGVPAWVDLDLMPSTRGIDLPGGPKPRPTAATTLPVRLPAEPSEPEADQDSDADNAPAEQSLSEP